MSSLIDRSLDFKIKQQLKDWENVLKETIRPTRPCITISREFGCEGYPLAEALGSKLKEGNKNWQVFGRDDFERLATDNHDIADNLFNALPTEPRNYITQYLDEVFANKPTNLKLYKEMARSVKTVSLKGNAVILGSAASIITQGQKNVFHVRLVASEEFKLKRLMKPDLDKSKAKELLLKKHSKRLEFIKEFTNLDIGDSHLYHIVFNNTYFTPDQMSDIIISMLKQRSLM